MAELRRHLPGLLGSAALAFAAEAVLARATGFSLAASDLAVSGACAALLAVCGGALVALLPLGAARGPAFGAAAALPTALVAGGLPWFVLEPGASRSAVSVALAVAALALGAASARATHSPRLAPAAVFAPIALAAVAVWGLDARSLPPPGALALWLAGWGALLALDALGRTRAAAPGGLAAETGRLLGAMAAVGFALLLPLRFSGAPVRWTASGPAPAGPDILVVSVDTLRADFAREMQVYERLAREGTAFAEVQASAPWTLPSLATLHTGLPVSRHGAGFFVAGTLGIVATAQTLAERLANAGYDTAALIARTTFAGPRYGFQRGFAFFDTACDSVVRTALPRSRATCGVHPVALHALLSVLPAPAAHRVAAHLGVPLFDGADGLVDRALAVAARRRERPLFLWLHLIDPHRPYRHVEDSTAPPELRERLARLSLRQLREEPLWRTPGGRDALLAAYRNEVDVVDRALLHLLDALGPPPPSGRIIVFTSDHGEEFLDHGGLDHGHSLHQELLAVPLVIAGAGRSTQQGVAGLVDLAPTLLARAGVPTDGLPGRDLFAAAPPEAPAYVSRNLLTGDPPGTQLGVRRGNWKLIASPNGPALYDLATDPHERRSRAGELPELARELEASAERQSAKGEPAALDAKDKEALRELGYLE